MSHSCIPLCRQLGTAMPAILHEANCRSPSPKFANLLETPPSSSAEQRSLSRPCGLRRKSLRKRVYRVVQKNTWMFENARLQGSQLGNEACRCTANHPFTEWFQLNSRNLAGLFLHHSVHWSQSDLWVVTKKADQTWLEMIWNIWFGTAGGGGASLKNKWISDAALLSWQYYNAEEMHEWLHFSCLALLVAINCAATAFVL